MAGPQLGSCFCVLVAMTIVRVDSIKPLRQASGTLVPSSINAMLWARQKVPTFKHEVHQQANMTACCQHHNTVPA